jgi:hypothetical protein
MVSNINSGSIKRENEPNMTTTRFPLQFIERKMDFYADPEDILDKALATSDICDPDKSLYHNLNQSMDALAVPFMVNRSIIETYWDALEQIRDKSSKAYWLLAARLTELTLLCAGQYADCGEFHCARDLLYGSTEHTTGLFPFFYRLLQRSERISRTYVIGLRMRWAAVVRMLKFLCAWRVESAEDFWQRYMEASFGDRYIIKNNLCCFDREIFLEMGTDISRVLQELDYPSSFLR